MEEREKVVGRGNGEGTVLKVGGTLRAARVGGESELKWSGITE